MSQWEPGDVVVLKFSSGEHRAILDEDGTWLVAGRSNAANYIVNRPLVVIDPEDGEAVERLHRSILRIYGGQKVTDVVNNTALMQAALREFADPTPPKPDEPMGLGAVVEDADGVRYVRTVTGEQDDNHLGKPWAEGVVRRNWQIVPAVRVLFHGVPA